MIKSRWDFDSIIVDVVVKQYVTIVHLKEAHLLTEGMNIQSGNFKEVRC